MPISQSALEQILKTNFPDAEVSCRDLVGDQDHWEVSIVDPVFGGKSRIEQHKMVHAATLGYDIHALSLKIAAK